MEWTEMVYLKTFFECQVNEIEFINTFECSLQSQPFALEF